MNVNTGVPAHLKEIEMPLPQQVQERADTAARYFEQLGNTEADDAQASAEPPAPEPLPDTESGQDSGDGDNPEGEKRQAEHQPETERGAAYWQHRFDVSEGRLRSVTDENRTLKETLKQRDARIAELEQSGGQQQGSLTPREVTKLEKLREEYGADLVDAIEALVEHKLPKGNVNDERVEQIEQRLQREEQERKDDLEARFWQRLHQLVPNLREINADQGFLQWLSEVDQFSGVPRQQLLTDAQNKLDAERVARLFDAYSKGAQPEAKPGKREIPADQVQPRQSRSVNSAPGDTKIWTQAEIMRFYEDKRKGVYTAEEGRRIEDDIFAAQQQGRIQ